jgi:hypothetical protein
LVLIDKPLTLPFFLVPKISSCNSLLFEKQ